MLSRSLPHKPTKGGEAAREVNFQSKRGSQRGPPSKFMIPNGILLIIPSCLLQNKATLAYRAGHAGLGRGAGQRVGGASPGVGLGHLPDGADQAGVCKACACGSQNRPNSTVLAP